jgi:hypothetical protein
VRKKVAIDHAAEGGDGVGERGGDGQHPRRREEERLPDVVTSRIASTSPV